MRLDELLLTTAFRQRPKAYGENVLMGFPAVVVAVTDGLPTVIDHNLYRVNLWDEPTMASFCLNYEPDLRTTVARAARELRNGHSSTQLAIGERARAVLEGLIKDTNEKRRDAVTTNAKTTKPTAVRVCADFCRRTCLMLSRDDGQVRHIPMSALGFEVETMGFKEFDKLYKELLDYPVEKAAQLYAEYARNLGASKEAMQELAKLTNVTPKDIDMATTKKAVTAAAAASKEAAKKKPAVKAEEKAKPATKAAAPKKDAKPAKPAKAEKTAAPAKKPAGEKKDTASSMIRGLIMEGKLPDSEIFKRVQKAYGLSDDKKWYPKWYRSDMTKKGMNPPAAVPEK